MTDFNYEKAYCVQALPAFQAFNQKQIEAHTKLLPIVKDLAQKKDLNIPLSEEIESILNDLSCLEIAELSRASYFVGHWKPSLMPELFDNKSGESWKIANVCDQILRKRLSLPHNILIHEGKFRVTFLSKDCWLWQEFGLATERNLEIFKKCNLSFNEMTLEKNANKLKAMCNDLWPDVDSMPNNDTYEKLLITKKENKLKKLKKQHAEKLADIEKEIENSKIRLEAFRWLVNHDIDIDNVIYYPHREIFSFGWRKPLSEDVKSKLLDVLCEFPYNYELK